MTIQTDSTPMAEPMDPEGCIVIALYALFASADEVDAMRADYARADFGYGHAKQRLYEAMEARFAPARARYDALIADPDAIEHALQLGARRARARAREVLARARAAVGLGARPIE